MWHYLHPRGSIITFRQAGDPYVASTAKPVRNFELRTSGRNAFIFPTWRQGTATVAGDLTPAAGTATVSFAGAAVALGGISDANGSSSTAFTGKAVAAGSMAAGGTTSVSFSGSTIAAASITPIAGTSTVQFSSGDSAFILPAASSASVTFTGGTVSAAAIAPSAGSGTVSFAGKSVATVAMVPVSGAASVGFTGSTSSGSGGTVDPAAVWNYVLPNGQTAGEMLMALMTLADELHRIHGLQPSAPLTVGQTSRQAGGIVQAISESGGVVTVTRAP